MDEQKENKKPECENCKDALEQYKITLEFLKFEGTTLWQIFNAFLTSNAIFLGFVFTTLASKEKHNYFIILGACVVGIILAFLWLASFYNNSKWYYYRIKNQAKPAEENYVKCIKNNTWFLLNKEAENYHPGIKNKYVGYLMIGLFMVTYLFISCAVFCEIICACTHSH